MDSMSYYHAYRPQQFRDLLGQDHVRTILLEALKQDRLAHAYLFSGTRGTGKTSTARLLAKAINCIAPGRADGEPCNACDVCLAITKGSCLDVIEIDAASNRGIDEIRQLQEQSRFQPQGVKRKIFIIDEVHMLTKEAFNALLKTLEEPPSHLLFILATTEPHKLPATIISRCQRFDFRTPDVETITQYVERMAKAEKLSLETDGAVQLAAVARGSFRDAATVLEQLVASAQGAAITAAMVSETLGLPDIGLVDRYLAALDGGDATDIFPVLQDYFHQGKSPAAFIDTAFQRFSIQVGKLKRPATVFGQLVRVKSQMRLSPVTHLPLIVSLTAQGEVSVISAPQVAVSVPNTGSPTAQQTGPALVAKKSVLPTMSDHSLTGEVSEKKTTTTADPSPKIVITELPAQPAAGSNDVTEMVTIAVAEQVPPATLPSGEVSEKWQLALAQLLEDSQSSLVSILRTAHPLSWDPPALRIGVQFKFHADQLIKQKNRDILEAAFQKVFGSPVRIDPEVVVVPDLAAAAEEIF